MIKTATVSPCGTYRYNLCRRWARGRRVLFVGLNPSTADADVDDATVRRLIKFATSWGFGAFSIVNIFAYRSKDPKDLAVADDPIGPDNGRHLWAAFQQHDVIIPMWGANGGLLGRDAEVLSLMRNSAPGHVLCFGTTKAGHPKHPLYLRADTELEVFNKDLGL